MLFPFDARWIYYEPEAKLLNEARPELGKHLLAENEFLVGAPQPRRASESRPLILRSLFDLHLHDWGSVGFPAEVIPAEHGTDLFPPDPEVLAPSANLAEGVWQALRGAWKLKGDLKGKHARALCRALFRYCTAIAHSPQYEFDHKDSLLQGWLQIPIVKDKAAFDQVVKLGETLAMLLDPLSDATSAVKALIGKDAKTPCRRRPRRRRQRETVGITLFTTAITAPLRVAGTSARRLNLNRFASNGATRPVTYILTTPCSLLTFRTKFGATNWAAIRSSRNG